MSSLVLETSLWKDSDNLNTYWEITCSSSTPSPPSLPRSAPKFLNIIFNLNNLLESSDVAFPCYSIFCCFFAFSFSEFSMQTRVHKKIENCKLAPHLSRLCCDKKISREPRFNFVCLDLPALPGFSLKIERFSLAETYMRMITPQSWKMSNEIHLKTGFL